ncbi:MAG: SpoIIIAH-like family protein [Clostridia bacterium]|nr:SpoIIIAH-like family protein [Clostridia bacterium]
MKLEKIKNFFKTRTAKSIVVASAALLIGLAVYLNYQWFYDPAGNLGYGDNNMDDNNQNSSAAGGDVSEEQNYFTSTALDRQEARDEALDVLKMVTESEEASEEAKAQAQEKISKIAVDIQNEANIETLVKAKGFEDCVAIISDNAVSVIVAAESLQAAEAAQILTIVYETTGINPENVSIISKTPV